LSHFFQYSQESTERLGQALAKFNIPRVMSMSNLRCACDHVIHDWTNELPFKATLLKSIDQDAFFNWITSEIQSYFLAEQNGHAKQWLLDRGYGSDYFELQLNHGNVLHDHIHTHYLGKKRDVYECVNCGRIHIEMSDNHFITYSPDNGRYGKVLDAASNSGLPQ
jgi:hypothetical protein